MSAGRIPDLAPSIALAIVAGLNDAALAKSTPSSKWAQNGEPDPHGTRYDCERAALAMGKLTDDELANDAFMNYDQRPPLQDIIDGKGRSPVMWMTAVKDRIRWLSRALAAATAGAKPSGEREALIAYLRKFGPSCNISMQAKEAADMLAADAQRDTSVLQAAPWPPVAQQVAVPQGPSLLINAEGSELLAEVFNRMTADQKNAVPSETAGRIGQFMVANGYRIVFTRWYLQELPKADAPPQRQPMPTPEIYAAHAAAQDQALSGIAACVHFARAIEAHHGIGVKP